MSILGFLREVWDRLRGPRWAARHWRGMVRRAGGEQALAARLLERRIVALTGPLWESTLEQAIARLLYLQDASPSRPVEVWIHSPGGHASAGLAFHDTMVAAPFPVSTYCFGHAGGIAALLLAAGTPGQRSVDPHSWVSLVDVSLEDWKQHSTTDQMWALHRVRTVLNELVAAQSGQDVRAVAEASREEAHLSAAEALLYGFADRIRMPPGLFLGAE